MGDVYCRVCGEPWDVAEVLAALKGRGDALTKEEAERLLEGKGCPCCKSREKGSHEDEYYNGLMEIDGEIDVTDYL